MDATATSHGENSGRTAPPTGYVDEAAEIVFVLMIFKTGHPKRGAAG
jgi:hypothetical protein